MGASAGNTDKVGADLIKFTLDDGKIATLAETTGKKVSYFDKTTGEKRVKPTEVEKVIRESRVVLTTCSGAGSVLLDAHEFPLVLVDEATQVREELLLCAVARGAQRLVIIGDPSQLSFCLPNLEDLTWISNEEKTRLENELLESTFKRMIADNNYKFLDTQYRMVEPIARFPSREFYQERLKTGTKGRRAIPFPWPDLERPLAFISVDGIEMRSGTSYHNAAEIEVVKKVIDCVLQSKNDKVERCEISVLSMYKGQVLELKKSVPAGVECGTVDSFQGRESPLVIVSTVRAKGHIGFSDKRERVNVLPTRAKYGLIVIGHEETLNSSELWQKWIRDSPKASLDDLRKFTKRAANPKASGDENRAKNIRKSKGKGRGDTKRVN